MWRIYYKKYDENIGIVFILCMLSYIGQQYVRKAAFSQYLIFEFRMAVLNVVDEYILLDDALDYLILFYYAR